MEAPQTAGRPILKSGLKLIALTAVYTVINALAFSLLPFSPGFKAQSLEQNAAPAAMLCALVCALWTVGTICFITARSGRNGLPLLLSTAGSVFMVQTFMTQVETLFFGGAFTALTRWDVAMIVAAGLFPVAAVSVLAMLLWKKPVRQRDVTVDPKRFLSAALLNGAVYVAVYFLFGYYVAWQSPELRMFYSGSTETISFIGKLIDNLQTDPMIFPFQWIRGVLFTVSILPLLSTPWKHRNDLPIAAVLVYLCSAVSLIVPNFLFPDPVRWAHFVEMASSMLLFAIVTVISTRRALQNEAVAADKAGP